MAHVSLTAAQLLPAAHLLRHPHPAAPTCRIAGSEGRHVAFLFTDSHIVSESFVEDINNLLNSGEITGLFPADERERIYADIRWGMCVAH